MFRLQVFRWFLIAALLLGLVLPTSPAWAQHGYYGGRGYGGHGYYGGRGYYSGHGYYGPAYYSHGYGPSSYSYGRPYGYSAWADGFTGYPAAYSYYPGTAGGSGGGCR